MWPHQQIKESYLNKMLLLLTIYPIYSPPLPSSLSLPKMAESISFFNFCHERSVPHRQCDFFDELVARFLSKPEDFRPSRLFSQQNIEDLAEELLHLVITSLYC